MDPNKQAVTELRPGIFQIRGLNGSSHSYVIKGKHLNVMIDSGSDQNFPALEKGLFQIGLRVREHQSRDQFPRALRPHRCQSRNECTKAMT
jgi:hypothetical protein